MKENARPPSKNILYNNQNLYNTQTKLTQNLYNQSILQVPFSFPQPSKTQKVWFSGSKFSFQIIANPQEANWRWEKHKKRGWIVFVFSSFSPTEVTDQKQIEFNFWSDNQNLNAADKNREREREREIERDRERERERKTQSNYTGSFHKPEVVLSPLHLQGEFTKM